MRRTLVENTTIGASIHLRLAHLQNPQQWRPEKRWAQVGDGALEVVVGYRRGLWIAEPYVMNG